MIKIEKKITGYKVVGEKQDAAVTPVPAAPAHVAPLDRPIELEGTTYRFKPGSPYKEGWVYVTVNDYVLDDGTLWPFEIFICQRDPRQVEYITAIALMISANLRRADDISFIPGELMQMCSPNGGFFAAKGSGLPTGTYIPSLVAAIGHVLDKHWRKTGVLVADSVSETTDVVSIDEAERQSVGAARVKPDSDQWCSNCNCAKVTQGGCATCPLCGSSSCG